MYGYYEIFIFLLSTVTDNWEQVLLSNNVRVMTTIITKHSHATFILHHITMLHIGDHNISWRNIADLNLLLARSGGLQGVTMNCRGQRSEEHLDCLRVLTKRIKVMELIIIGLRFLLSIRKGVRINGW